MFGLFKKAPPPPAKPAFALPELKALDAYQFYAACLALLFVLKTLIGIMRRSRVRAAAAKGSAAKFVPVLGKDAPAPAGSKGKAVVVGGGCARPSAAAPRPPRTNAAAPAAALAAAPPRRRPLRPSRACPAAFTGVSPARLCAAPPTRSLPRPPRRRAARARRVQGDGL
jgi:hypothetical protein